jgi:prolyl-tRNA synthetase
MRQSKLFTKTTKQAPADEPSLNARLLEQAGFVSKLMAGVYSYLPLGFRVLSRIENIVREEMDVLGACEVLMPALHPRNIWDVTGRWNTPIMFRMKSQTKREYGLGWTHEEVITPLVQKYCSSYKDLPVAVFQIQTKFRDELRAKSGLLRSREFRMKDLYSFHENKEDMDRYYESVKETYFKIFDRCGFQKDRTYLTLALGGEFSKYSHEFQVITKSGEDTIHICNKCGIAFNDELFGGGEAVSCFECSSKDLRREKAIEVGNIFKLKDRFSKAFNYTYLDRKGRRKIVVMGCHGLGTSRIMGALVETNHDERGVIWPRSVAPFGVHLIYIPSRGKKVLEESERLYTALQNKGVEILYDDREDMSAGEKLVDADLIGIPMRLVVSEKALQKESGEFKLRGEEKAQLVKLEKAVDFCQNALGVEP